MRYSVLAVIVIGLFVLPAFSADMELVGKLRETPLVKDFMVGTKSDLIDARDMGNFYELVLQQNNRRGVLYLSKDGGYIFLGARLYDKNKRNLTVERLRELNRLDFAKLDTTGSLVVKKGTGEKKFIMITDVDCPVCRSAREWLKTQTNYTMYIFLYPSGMHPKAKEKTIKIFCSADPVGSIDLAETDKEIPAKKCKSGEEKVKKHMSFADDLDIGGTPLFILGDGMKVEGYDREQIESYLKN